MQTWIPHLFNILNVKVRMWLFDGGSCKRKNDGEDPNKLLSADLQDKQTFLMTLQQTKDFSQ